MVNRLKILSLRLIQIPTTTIVTGVPFQKDMYDLYGQCDVWECDWRRLELYNSQAAAPPFRQWSFSTSFCTTQGRREHKHK